MDIVDPIFPRRFVPPFLRSQFMQEKVVHTRVWVCGFYDDARLDNKAFRYYAEREDKHYMVKFSGGTIYLHQGG